jgi:hypothetical protein
MSTTRVVRYSVEDASDPSINPTFSQSDSGNSWTVSGTTYTSSVQNGLPATKLAVWTFTQDFRKQDPVYGISQNRCIVKLRCAPAGGFPPAGENAGGFFGSIRWQNTYSGNFGGPPFGFTDRFQTGNDVTTTTANLNEINGLELAYRAGSATTTNSNGLFFQSIQIQNPRLQGNTGLAGSLFFSWEANNHAIDGLNGDTAPVITTQCSLTANASVNRFASSNIQADCSLSENSVSVITGVEKTLENNFSISAVGQVKYSISRTLRQETELLGTTFNFRFADPLTISADYSLTNTISLKRGLGANLIVSADANAISTAVMIYDISVDYVWDDFSINGKFSNDLVDGSIEYTWDGVDYFNWGTWPDDNWEQTDISWDEWPVDAWAVPTIVADFNTQNIGNAKTGGIGSLLSTTALSNTAAFLKAAASTMSADFLCDGSPSGLIGGTSTIISDAVLTALANYIVNNAQNIDGAFNATLLANYIAKFLWSVSSDFSLTVSPRFKPSGVTNAQCITIINALAHAKYGPSPTLQGAFDPEFIPRLFVGTDPYNIHKLLQETRQIFVDAESRGIQIAEEIRLNSIPAEDRDHLVPQETRSMKLRIPPMTNRFSTPKVRTE